MEDDNIEFQPVWHGLAGVPVRPTLKREEGSGYGTIAELEGEEPADPVELERMATWELWGPVLKLWGGCLPSHVEFGSCLSPDWEAIGMIDCLRLAAARRAR
jgi:hypothetical protein